MCDVGDRPIRQESTRLYHCTGDTIFYISLLCHSGGSVSKAVLTIRHIIARPHGSHRRLQHRAATLRLPQTRSRLAWIVVWNNKANSVQRGGHGPVFDHLQRIS